MPVTGAWISCVKLSVSISTTGSPMLTGSPTRLNHRPTYNFETPAIFGTFISVAIIPHFFAFSPSSTRRRMGFGGQPDLGQGFQRPSLPLKPKLVASCFLRLLIFAGWRTPFSRAENPPIAFICELKKQVRIGLVLLGEGQSAISDRAGAAHGISNPNAERGFKYRKKDLVRGRPLARCAIEGIARHLYNPRIPDLPAAFLESRRGIPIGSQCAFGCGPDGDPAARVVGGMLAIDSCRASSFSVRAAIFSESFFISAC